MIIATAGHVDHGKTLLVKALTGIDADRLPEEKRRGLTIDLGFAYLPVASLETVGFVDVPGHERFIHNMLCGLPGIDFSLFIVAADDGPMPQTREHLAILDLLGVSSGAIALTKIDRVAPARVAEVRAELEELFANTTLAAAPVFPVSAVTGEGVERLKDHLLETARACRPRQVKGNFRLAIDRCFSLAGAGVIVTGTAVSGSIAVGDHARILRAGLPVRVRSIHAQNASSESGKTGQRCALNLTGAGLRQESIVRGDWVVTGGVPDAVNKFDVRLRVLSSEPRPFLNWTPVHVHLGAAGVTGRIAVLGGSSIAPGASGLAQVVLDEPIGAVRGDGLIVRDQSAQRTIGGGRVIDVFPPPRGRAKPERLAYLAAMEHDDDRAALASLLDLAPAGVNLSRFAANRNLSSQEAADLFSRAKLKHVAGSNLATGFSEAHWAAAKTALVQALAAWHRRSPNASGPPEDRLVEQSGLRLPREAASAAVAELVREGALVREATGLRLSSHTPRLSPADAAVWNNVAPLLEANAARPPVVHEIAAALREDPRKVEAFLKRASQFGLVVRVAENRFFRPNALRDLGRIVEELGAQSRDRMVTAAAFRDRTGIGRTVAIEVLEFFDRVKFTRRVGDAHVVVRPSAEVFGNA
jgi:selenocysteine-specific elongation factor